jgi:Ni2+-binding GTPase involved in maturation of urease and hydrogenase
MLGEIIMINKDDFMDYVGYRNTVVEEKIEECLSEIRSGKTEISVDRGDLTDSELEYLYQELDKRLK